MPPCCPLAHAGGGGYRGPPPPLILAPIIYQLVRRSCDPKMVAYVKNLVAKEGPQAVAANAHKIVQYTLSKVPANVLYWFTSKVLNLPPETAMQTTEFLKSRTEIEMPGDDQTPLLLPSRLSCDGAVALITEGGGQGGRGLAATADIERRLERLEMDYQILQQKHNESIKLLTYKPEDVYLPVCLFFSFLLDCKHLTRGQTERASHAGVRKHPIPDRHMGRGTIHTTGPTRLGVNHFFGVHR